MFMIQRCIDQFVCFTQNRSLRHEYNYYYYQGMRNMIKSPLLYLLISIHTIQAIVQNCSLSSPTVQCPKHSFCNQNFHCQCDPGYIFDCQTKAHPITEQPKQFQLQDDKETMFLITPSQSNLVVFYKFNFCHDATQTKTVYNFALYFDNGASSELEEKHKIGKIKMSQSRECWSVLSPYLRFDQEQNGITEQMILVIKPILPKLQQTIFGDLTDWISGETNQGQHNKVKLTVSVSQLSFFNIETLWAILISFLSFTLISFIGGIMYCIYWWRRGGRRNRYLRENNLDHFQKYMPKVKLTSSNMNNVLRTETTCSICLFEFKDGDTVRKTTCIHTFHHDCLDQWCRKNLTCPVCRHSLTKDDITQNSTTASTKSMQAYGDFPQDLDQDATGAYEQNMMNPSQFNQQQMPQDDYSQMSESWKLEQQHKIIREKLIN